ncbi:hypothetical protein VTI74DRAFT_7048 [Chaetomium olivicolor]
MSHYNPEEIDLSDAEDSYSNPPTNTNEDFDIAQDPNLAATLGFTAFGAAKRSSDDDGTRGAKKRRYNPQVDNAIVDVHPNLTAQKANADKITYQDEEEVDYGDFELNTNADPNSNVPPTLAGGASGGSTPGAAGGTGWSQPAGTGFGRGAVPGSAPQSQTSYSMSYSNRGGRGGGRGGGTGRGGHGHGHGHGMNPNWYIDYYDPSSNENPWEGMEKYKGLEPVGTWLTWADRHSENGSNNAGGVGMTAGDGRLAQDVAVTAG